MNIYRDLCVQRYRPDQPIQVKPCRSYGDGTLSTFCGGLVTAAENFLTDANVNMTSRVEGGLTYTQTFDAENRLISVTVSGQTTTFVYDGDGNLVKKIKPDGSKTLYVGGIYEVDKASGGAVTRTVTYYPVAGAMRINSTLYYTLKDHLGSASVVTNASGVEVGTQRYYPFGETRVSTGTIYTDRLFTGQREMAGLGIYHYGARFYSPKIGRFLSPDTIVPGYANPQNLNRMSYVTNNPLRYTDPTGHMMTDEGGGGVGGCGGPNQPSCGGGGGGGGNDDDDDDPNPSGYTPPTSGGGGCVPYPGQWLCDLDALQEDSSHYYELTNVVCPASWDCTEAEMIYYLSLFAYPGQDPLNGPAQPLTNYSVSPPFGWFPDGSDLSNLGLIQVSTENGGLVSINTTMESHIFCCGTVRRSLTQDASGAWSVTTVGAGTNSNSLIAGVNNGLGPGLFQNADTLMLIYIMEQKFPEPFPVP